MTCRHPVILTSVSLSGHGDSRQGLDLQPHAGGQGQARHAGGRQCARLLRSGASEVQQRNHTVLLPIHDTVLIFNDALASISADFEVER